MPQTLNISHTFENPAFSRPDKRFVVTFVNTTDFFFHEGVWRHACHLVSGGMLKNATHTSPGNPV